jgi:hypothetical protein
VNFRDSGDEGTRRFARLLGVANEQISQLQAEINAKLEVRFK